MFRSRTRRTISRAVTAWPFFEANAVYPISATSASETQQSSWSSQIARGYRIGVQASSAMAAIAARMLGFIGHGDGEPRAAAADRADAPRRCRTPSPSGPRCVPVQPESRAVPIACGGQAGRAARGGGVPAAQPGGGDHRRGQRRADHRGQRVQAPDQQRSCPGSWCGRTSRPASACP